MAPSSWLGSHAQSSNTTFAECQGPQNSKAKELKFPDPKTWGGGLFCIPKPAMTDNMIDEVEGRAEPLHFPGLGPWTTKQSHVSILGIPAIHRTYSKTNFPTPSPESVAPPQRASSRKCVVVAEASIFKDRLASASGSVDVL